MVVTQTKAFLDVTVLLWLVMDKQLWDLSHALCCCSSEA